MSHRIKAETRVPRVPSLCPGGDLLENQDPVSCSWGQVERGQRAWKGTP